MTRILFRLRMLVWLVVLVGAVALWTVNRPVTFDQSVEGFFPPEHPALRSYQQAKRAFGGDDFVFVAYEDRALWTPDGMDRIHELAKALRHDVPGVVRVESLDQMPLPWKVDAAVQSLVGLSAGGRTLALPRLLGGLSTVASEVRAAADHPERLQLLRDRVCSTPLFRRVLVDSNGTTTALVVQLTSPDESDHKQVVRGLREQAHAFGQHHRIERVAVVGPPVLLADGFTRLEKDNRTLGLAAMGLMALTMFVAVRSPWWGLLPLVSGWTTWLVTQAFLNYLDLRLTLSAGPIIAQTVVLCMPAASHLAVHFRESLGQWPDRDDAARHTLRTVFVPVAWCTLTAAAGYLALLSSTVQPVFQFGVTMAASNLLAGVLAYLLSAGAMRPPRWLHIPPVPSKVAEDRVHVGRLITRVIDHPVRILALAVLPSLVVAFGIMRLRFESDYIRIYRTGSRVVQDYQFVEGRMGGIGLVELIVPAPRDRQGITPDWLDSLADAAAAVRAIDTDLISEVLSLADVLRSEAEQTSEPASSTEANPDQSAERVKPGLLSGIFAQSRPSRAPPEQVIQTKLNFLSAPGFTHFISNFWNRSDGQTRLLVRIRESADAGVKQRAFDEMLNAVSARFGSDCSVTGLSYLMTQVTHAVISTQFQSTAWSCVVILSMLALALRSFILAVLALLPTLMAVALVLGAMGWLGIKVDLSTALVASVAMGLSVDDTFHCLLRRKRELREGRTPLEALRRSYAGAGPGVVLSSAAVSIGFLTMIFSEFVPTANFGWLVAVATLGGSLGNLVVLPACLAVLDRPNGCR